jgi:hypothetical protein
MGRMRTKFYLRTHHAQGRTNHSAAIGRAIFARPRIGAQRDPSARDSGPWLAQHRSARQNNLSAYNLSIIAAAMAFYIPLSIFSALPVSCLSTGNRSLGCGATKRQSAYQDDCLRSWGHANAVVKCDRHALEHSAGNRRGGECAASAAKRDRYSGHRTEHYVQRAAKRGFFKVSGFALLLTFGAIVLGTVSLSLEVALPVTLAALDLRNGIFIIISLSR